MQIDRTVGKRKRRRRVKRWVCVCGLRRASVLGLEWPLKSEHSERERERERCNGICPKEKLQVVYF